MNVVSSGTVCAQSILLAIQHKAGVSDPVGKTADGLSHTRPVVLIALEIIVAQRHIGKFSLPIRYLDRYDRGPEVGQLYGSSVCIGQFIQNYGLSFGRNSPHFLFDIHNPFV